ncbi:Maf family protein [Akkermansiaceae bacterium]|nr:Maf family protein [Akkermansiaceae bacterium]MDB4544394.1 Maf family protein [Akkermansiaceae bacterium]
MIGLEGGNIEWELILASGSPRRRDLLREAGLSFQINSPDVEELTAGAEPPRKLCLANAHLKADAVAKLDPFSTIIAADTVVALGGQVYGKPVDLEEAASNLRVLRGRVHEVMTGVVIIHDAKCVSFVETSYVKFRDFSDEVIEEYLAKVPVLDKAGGYAIQDHGDLLVEKIEGDYDNIVGLPISLVLDQLAKIGFPLPTPPDA